MRSPDFTKIRSSRRGSAHLTVALVVGFTVAAGCMPSDPPARPSPPPADLLAYELRTLRAGQGDCDATQQSCVRVALNYLEAVAGPAAAQSAVNEFQAGFLTEQLRDFQTQEIEEPAELERLVDGFVLNYQAVLEDLPGTLQRWTFETDAEVALNTPRRTTLKLSLNTYTGGAHPNFLVQYATFDVETGVRLSAGDLVTNVDSLRARVERAFRSAHDLTPDESLTDAGFFFEDGAFDLSPNIALTETGLVVYYNPYDVAPYALGPTEVLLPFPVVSDLLTEPPPGPPQ